MNIEIIFTQAILSEDKSDCVILDLYTQEKIHKNFFSINFALTSMTENGKEFIPHFIDTIKHEVFGMQKDKPTLRNVFVLIPLNPLQIEYFRSKTNLESFEKLVSDEIDIYDKRGHMPYVTGVISEPMESTPSSRLKELKVLEIDEKQDCTFIFNERNISSIDLHPDLAMHLFLVER